MSQINTMDRFKILRKHDFTCVFCGSKPGNELLEIDHMIPCSIGGSDHESNLVCACRKCNNGKREQIAIPITMCDPVAGSDGWVVWKRWGNWSIQWLPCSCDLCGIVIEHVNRYWIGFDRVHEPDWEPHIMQKDWMRSFEERYDFACALDFARSVVDS